MPDCAMCWNEWPTLTETPFPQLAGIQVCRNCGRSMKQMIAFCRNHGLNVIPQDGDKLPDAVTAVAPDSPTSGDEPSPTPSAKPARKGR